MPLFRATLDAIRKGLGRTREALGGGLSRLLRGRTLSEEVIDGIEAQLLTADVGVATTSAIIGELRRAYRAGEVSAGEDALSFLKQQL
jgi:fused signal recognition particle receptor